MRLRVLEPGDLVAEPGGLRPRSLSVAKERKEQRVESLTAACSVQRRALEPHMASVRHERLLLFYEINAQITVAVVHVSRVSS